MAVPNPEVELARLEQLAARGLPAVVVVTGASDFFRTEAMDRLLAAVPAGADLRVVDAGDDRGGGGGRDDDRGDEAGEAVADTDGDGAAPCPELQDLRGGGLFTRAAFVAVRRGSGWWKRHAPALAAQLPRIAAGSGLLLEAAKLDKRKRAAQTLVRTLAEGGALFEFRELHELPWDRSRGPLEGELCKWVVGRARKLGLPLRPDAALLLTAQVGRAPAQLLAELGRLRDRMGDGVRTALTPDDLRGRLTCSFESTPFEFAEAVLAGDRRAAWRSARAMFDRGVRGKDGAPMDPGGLLPFTTSWLYQQFASTLEGRQLLDDGVPLCDVAARVGVHQFAERFTAQVQQLDQRRLRAGLLALHACQRSSRLTGEEPDVLIERFLQQWFDGAPVPTAEDFEL